MLRNDLGYQAPYVGKSDEEWRELHSSYDDEGYDRFPFSKALYCGTARKQAEKTSQIAQGYDERYLFDRKSEYSGKERSEQTSQGIDDAHRHYQDGTKEKEKSVFHKEASNGTSIRQYCVGRLCKEKSVEHDENTLTSYAKHEKNVSQWR